MRERAGGRRVRREGGREGGAVKGVREGGKEVKAVE